MVVGLWWQAALKRCLACACQVRPIDAVPGHGSKVCTACLENQVTVFQEDQVVYSATYDHVYDQNSEQVRAARPRCVRAQLPSLTWPAALLATARDLQRLLPTADP